jgi:hypothetical protein
MKITGIHEQQHRFDGSERFANVIGVMRFSHCAYQAPACWCLGTDGRSQASEALSLLRSKKP